MLGTYTYIIMLMRLSPTRIIDTMGTMNAKIAPLSDVIQQLSCKK